MQLIQDPRLMHPSCHWDGCPICVFLSTQLQLHVLTSTATPFISEVRAVHTLHRT